jgi:hypothetical protein
VSAEHNAERYRAGEVVYFHHLHGDVRAEVQAVDKDGEYCVLVEGKPRRMLILGRCLRVRLETVRDTTKHTGAENQVHVYEAKAREDYAVVCLRSEPNPRDRHKFENFGKGFLTAKGPRDAERETWISRELYVYAPENACTERWLRIDRKNDRVLQYIKGMVGFKRLGWYRA